MKSIFHPSEDRGYANHGWLNAKHSFSFAGWYNPEKVHFGALRVLNDDTVAPAMGFSKHPHDNMEIITIPLKGGVYHKDSMGHGELIEAGEIQVMSAGTGIYHSEMNGSHHEELKLFQIWIFPNQRNVEPRYDQFKIDYSKMQNEFLQLISPNKDDSGSWINQNAWISMIDLSEGSSKAYYIHAPNNGVYIMNIDGKVLIEENELGERDAIGIWESKTILLRSEENSRILLIEVPMNEEAYA